MLRLNGSFAVSSRGDWSKRDLHRREISDEFSFFEGIVSVKCSRRPELAYTEGINGDDRKTKGEARDDDTG